MHVYKDSFYILIQLISCSVSWKIFNWLHYWSKYYCQCFNYSSSVEKTKIKCKTSRLSNRLRRSTDTVKIDDLLVFFDGSPPASSPVETFQYVPDPIITNITPQFTFPRYVSLCSFFFKYKRFLNRYISESRKAWLIR